jgi:hypothetical protein
MTRSFSPNIVYHLGSNLENRYEKAELHTTLRARL